MIEKTNKISGGRDLLYFSYRKIPNNRYRYYLFQEVELMFPSLKYKLYLVTCFPRTESEKGKMLKLQQRNLAGGHKLTTLLG